MASLVWLTLVSWGVPFFASFAFVAPPDPSAATTSQQQQQQQQQPGATLRVERNTFKAAMVVVAGATNAVVVMRAVRGARLAGAAGDAVQNARDMVLMTGGALMMGNLLLDLVVLVPIAGLSFMAYMEDIGLRYVGVVLAVVYYVDALLEMAAEAGAKANDADAAKDGGVAAAPLRSNLLCFVLLLMRAPLTFAVPYGVSGAFFESSGKDGGAFSGPLREGISQYLFETTMMITRAWAFAYFLVRVFKDVGPRRVRRWSFYVALVFLVTNVVLDVGITLQVRKDVGWRYVAETALMNAGLLFPWAWIAFSMGPTLVAASLVAPPPSAPSASAASTKKKA